MTRLAEFIRPKTEYHRSVNLERDADNAEVLSGYLPTARAIEAVTRFVRALSDPSRPRAWSITGPYGSGKSSFAFFLQALVGSSRESVYRSARQVLADADVSRVDALIAGRRACSTPSKGFLRCLATAQLEPASMTVMRALLNGSDRFWQGPGRRPREVGRLRELVDEAKRNGELPGPDELLGIVEGLSDHAPLLLVIDEMGKNLEFAALRGEVGDIFILQQIAERFSGADGLPGFLFTLQHLAFDDYAADLPSVQRQEWNKIQGRFEDLPFLGSREQAFQVIGSIMEFDRGPRGFASWRRSWAQQGAEACARLGLRELLPEDPKVLEGCYPLHPLSVAVLPELCSWYGQHDRSLFTFFTGPEVESVASFIGRERWSDAQRPLIGLDSLYDYFVEPLGASLFQGQDASRWLEVQRCIREAEGADENQVRCLKVIGVLNLISSGGPLRASGDVLEFALGDPPLGNDQPAVSAILQDLQQAGLVTYREFADEYRVWRGSDYDLAGAIRQQRERLAPAPLAEQLTLSHPMRPLVAHRHSQLHGCLRYFERRYADSISSDASPSSLDPTSDGLLLYLVGDQALPEKPPERTVSGQPVIYVRSPDVGNVRAAALETAAIARVLESDRTLADDKVARAEARHRAAVAQSALAARLEDAFRPGRSEVEWIIPGRHVTIERPEDLSRLLSDLCDDFYPDTPTIRHEMLNRRELTSQGAKARRELIEAMILKPGEERLGFSGYGPERSLYESVLAATGLHRDGRDGLGYTAPRKSSGIDRAWKAIDAFFGSATKEQRSLDDLYGLLMAPPYGVKEGPLPVLITAALLHRADEVAIYQDGTYQPFLTPELIERLAKIPARFSVKRFSLRGNAGLLLEEYRRLLGVEGAASSRFRNATLLGVVKPLMSLAKELPEYTMKTRRLSQAAQAVRHTLVATREPDDLIFHALPEACGAQVLEGNKLSRDAFKSFTKDLSKALLEIQGAYDGLLAQLADLLREQLGTKGPESALREDLRARSRHIRDQVIDPRMRSFLLMATNEDLEDREWIEALAMNLTDKPPRTWTDDDVARFSAALTDVASRFRRLELLHYEMRDQEHQDGFDAKRLTVTSPDGNELARVIWLDQPQSEVVSTIAEEMLARIDEAAGERLRGAVLSVLAERILSGSDAPKQEDSTAGEGLA